MTIARVWSRTFILLAACLGLASIPAAAQEPDAASVEELRREVGTLKSDLDFMRSRVNWVKNDVRELQEDYEGADYVPYGFFLFVVGVFCALWAQNTGRGAWGWFFAGVFFHMFTLLVLLSKNANDRRAGKLHGFPFGADAR